jgi:hypothetical protein
MNATVPLWLGTMLRRRKLAKIVPPSWMDVDHLREVLRYERDIRQASFHPELPFRHAELSRAILSACRAGSGTGSSAAVDGAGSDGVAEIPHADQIKLLLEDIGAVRMDKIRRNVHQLSGSTLRHRSSTESVIDVTNIGSLEMHSIKSFVLESFRLQRELSGKGSSYSYSVEPESGGGGGGGSSSGGLGGGRRSSSGSGARGGSGSGGGMVANANRGRLQQQSRLVREVGNNDREEQEEERGGEEEEEEEEQESLMVPRPLEEEEEMKENDDMDNPIMGNADANVGRSRLRRHRQD